MDGKGKYKQKEKKVKSLISQYSKVSKACTIRIEGGIWKKYGEINVLNIE